MSRMLILLFAFSVPLVAYGEESGSFPHHEKLARYFVSLHVDPIKLERLYDEESISMVRLYEERFFLHYRRNFTSKERIELLHFLREKFAQMMPADSVQKVLADFVVKNTSAEELAEINKFLISDTGQRLASLRKDLSEYAKTVSSNLLSTNLTRERVIAIRHEIEKEFPELSVPWGD